MLDTLHTFQKKYHLSLGDTPSSPVMEFSAGLGLQYAGQIANVPLAERKPLYLCVPNKKDFTVHFTCILLLHYLFEDCFDIKTIHYEIGDKVELNGSIAKYQGKGRSVAGRPSIRLLFADDIICEYPAHNATALTRASVDRKLTKPPRRSKDYHSIYDLNRLLGLSKKDTVNLDTLGSKLYLVTGRGYTVSTRERLKKEICFNQSLSEVFRLDTNLIVTPNLEAVKPVFDSSGITDDSFFTESLTDDLTEIAEVYKGDSNLLNLIGRLAGQIERKEFTPVFHEIFNQLTDSVDTPHRDRLLNLASQIPPEKTALPEDLKLVVLANATLAADYANTINGLVAHGIPVIILTDRSELASVHDKTLEGSLNGYRFCWSKRLIKGLMDGKAAEYGDDRFWQQCLRYANQRIIVQSYHDPIGDELFNTFESNSVFARLDGFENLKKAYYQHLRPAFYLLKNTPGNHQNINGTVQEQTIFFSQAFDSVSRQLPSELATLVTKGLSELKRYSANPKRLPDDQPVFIQQIEFPDRPKQRTTQLTQKSLRVDDIGTGDCESLTFSGFPYREWNGRYLFNAVFDRHVPSITVLAWPAEAHRTISYLSKRLQATSIDNWLPQWISNGIVDWELPYRQECPSESDIILREDEGYDIVVSVAEPSPADVNFEEVQRHISEFRFASLFGQIRDPGEYRVLVDVLHFNDGSYMFLPRGSHIYAVSRERKIVGGIDQAAFKDLSVGDHVVCFNMNRDIIRWLAREQLAGAYEQLDIWRSHLQSLLNAEAGQFDRLEASLMHHKESLGLSTGSPSRQNILRWLYEIDMLAPQNANLWLILLASGLSEKEAKNVLGRIDSAKRLIIRNSSQVSGRIRTGIMAALKDSQTPEGDIQVNVDGVSVSVKCGRITDKEEYADLEVSYAATKRFIRD